MQTESQQGKQKAQAEVENSQREIELELNSAKVSIESLNSQNAEISKQLVEARAQNNSLDESYQQSLKELVALQDKITSLTTQIIQLYGKNANLDETLQQATESTQTRLQSLEIEYQAKIIPLQKQLEESISSAKSLADELDQIREQKELSEGLRLELTKKLETTQSELRSEIVNKVQKIQEAENLKDNLKTLESEKTSTQSNLETVKKENEAQASELNDLKSQLLALENQLTETTSFKRF